MIDRYNHDPKKDSFLISVIIKAVMDPIDKEEEEKLPVVGTYSVKLLPPRTPTRTMIDTRDITAVGDYNALIAIPDIIQSKRVNVAVLSILVSDYSQST